MVVPTHPPSPLFQTRWSRFGLLLSAAVFVLVQLSPSQAWSTSRPNNFQGSSWIKVRIVTSSSRCYHGWKSPTVTALWVSNDNDESGAAPVIEEPPSIPVESKSPVVAPPPEDHSAYPINLPSPLLLSASMVLAIASTGSLFELVGGTSTTLGFAPTAALCVLGLPLCLYLFNAAVLKATAETAEDDERFLKGK